jgi:hypothetical protein
VLCADAGIGARTAMLVAGLVVVAFGGLVIYLLVSNVDSLPRTLLKFLGYLLIFVSSVELLILIWVLVFIEISDWSLWDLSFDSFWREQLSAIYFIKEWLYSWLWNDLLNLFFVFMPAVVFLTLRTIITTVLGFWALAASKR